MSTSRTWHTTVDFIMGQFREALVRLVPVYEAMNLPWRNEKAYDEWEKPVESLFVALVENTIRFDPALSGILPFARYDFLYPDYRGLSFIAVEDGSGASSALMRFATRAEPFDEVLVHDLDGTLNCLRQRQIPRAGVTFSLNSGDGSSRILRHELAVET